MTKRITKVIAALGVVAGLGVAALPLSSYAASSDVQVSVTINKTTGTVAPDCGSNPGQEETSANGGAGEIVDATCNMGGTSNTGISVSIKDKDTTLDLTHTNGTNKIEAISATANLTDSAFAFSNIGSINSGRGGWGYKFVAGSAANLTTQGNYANWNGITASDVVVAQSPTANASASMNGTSFAFRAVTPANQAVGTYSDVVVVTVATLP